MRRLHLLSNVNIDIIKQFLAGKCEVTSPEGYGAWDAEIMNPESPIYKSQYEDIIILLEANEILKKYENYSSAWSRLQEIFIIIDRLIKSSISSNIWVADIDIQSRRCRCLKDDFYEKKLESEWMSLLNERQTSHPNVYILEVKSIVENIGRKAFYSPKTWYVGGIPYSLSATKDIAALVSNNLERLENSELKCLAVDFDGTLWGGVIAEDGVEGIVLSEHGDGEIYYNLQLQIKRLVNQGTILVGLTKNNEDDALKAFDHPSMVLGEEDFVLIKSNWNDKWLNLKSAIKDLNIGLDSVAFLDDNPVERDLMKENLPTVDVIDFPEKIYELETVFIKFAESHFNKVKITEDDLAKTKMYKAEGERIQKKEISFSFNDYVKSLEIEVDFHEMKEDEIDRAEQLFRKTNQFNLTGRRYSKQDLEELLKRNGKVYVSKVKDKYGDYGTVSALTIEIDGQNANMGNFVMSCRVMGRNVEFQILDCMRRELRKQKIESITSEYISTGRNDPVKDLLDNSGFEIIVAEDGYKRGVLYLNL